MSQIKLFIGGLVVLAAVGAGIFLWTRQSKAAIGSLNIYHGAVDITRDGVGTEGATGMKVRVGDVLKTGPNSRISVILLDGSVVRIDEESEAEVSALAYREKKIGTALFRLHYGKLWSDVTLLAPGGTYMVETPTLVASVRGTNFNVSYISGLYLVQVITGSVAVALLSDRVNEKVVTSSMVFAIRDGSLREDFDRGPEPLSEESRSDGWTQFNVIEGSLESDTPPNLPVQASATSTTPVLIDTPAPRDAPDNSGDAPKQTPTDKKTPEPQPSKPLDTNRPEPQPQSEPQLQPEPQPQPTQGSPKTLISILLLPKQAGIKVSATVTLSATGRYNDNSLADITAQVSWIQKPEIGIISKAGVFQATQGGTTVIQASLNGLVSNDAVVTVQGDTQPAPAKTISSLQVSFEKQQNAGSTVAPGLPGAQFTAIAVYSDKSSEDVTQQTAWSIIAGNAEGTITSSGWYTPRSQGFNVVRAEFKGIKTDTQIGVP